MAQEDERNAAIRKMTELLRAGATMLAETCPICNAPLFRLPSGEVLCPIHGRVFIAKSEEEVAEASVISTLSELEKTACSALIQLINAVKRNEMGLDEAARIAVYWLDAIERAERIKDMIRLRKAMGQERKR